MRRYRWLVSAFIQSGAVPTSCMSGSQGEILTSPQNIHACAISAIDSKAIVPVGAPAISSPFICAIA